MTLADKLLILSILVVLFPFSYAGMSFGIEPNDDKRKLVQIWKINKEDNYTYSLSSIMEHHSNATAIKVMKIFKSHIKRIVDIFTKKLRVTEGDYILVVWENNGTELFESYSSYDVTNNCEYGTSYAKNFTSGEFFSGGAGGGCGDGYASGGGGS